MRKITQSLIAIALLQAFTVNSITASILDEPHVASFFKRQIDSLVDSPYKVAARYMPVLEKALSHCSVPFKAKRLSIKRYVYEAGQSQPVESLNAIVDIKRNGLLGQVITAKGKLNDWDLVYKNNFKFSILGKGTMEVESTLDGKPFIDLNIFANKRKSTTNVVGKLLDRDVNYLTKTSATTGILAGHAYMVDVKSITGANGDVVAIKADGNIGEYSIKGTGYKRSENLYEIEEIYGPLVIKTEVRVIS